MQTMGFKLKADIFCIFKFITNVSQLEFSMDLNSLCQYVCTQMHITGAQQGAFWTAVKDTVKHMIEKQRTNATSGCKQAFQGKFESPFYQYIHQDTDPPLTTLMLQKLQARRAI
jgi:hypothetical protein